MSMGKERELAADHPEAGHGDAKRMIWEKRSALHEPLEKPAKIRKGAGAESRADGNLKRDTIGARQSFLHPRES